MSTSTASLLDASLVTFTLERIRREDRDAIVEIDAIHTGVAKHDYWYERLAPLLAAEGDTGPALGFIARSGSEVIGFILAEGRAWEFGSPLCGWIVAIGVRPEHARRGIAFALCQEVCSHFKSLGISSVRTMVRKDDVNVLSFFRGSGFRAGPFIELEVGLQEGS